MTVHKFVTFLPAKYNYCSSLETLILVDNNITEIPSNFYKLENLHTLW